MRRPLLLAAVVAGLAACADDAAPVTVEGVEPVQADGDLTPDTALQPDSTTLAPDADLAPESTLAP